MCVRDECEMCVCVYERDREVRGSEGLGSLYLTTLTLHNAVAESVQCPATNNQTLNTTLNIS